MTEDIESEFNGIVFASYSMDERQLLRRFERKFTRALPHAKTWTFDNVPEEVFRLDYPMTEALEIISAGIDGWFDFHFANGQLEAHLKLTEAEDAYRRTQRRDPQYPKAG